MQVNNLTSAMGTTVGWTDTMIKNISFTPYEWARFADMVNQSNANALRAGLVIGAIAGIIGFGAAMWYKEKYGED
jgi:hypothetical protein